MFKTCFKHLKKEVLNKTILGGKPARSRVGKIGPLGVLRVFDFVH